MTIGNGFLEWCVFVAKITDVFSQKFGHEGWFTATVAVVVSALGVLVFYSLYVSSTKMTCAQETITSTNAVDSNPLIVGSVSNDTDQGQVKSV